MKVTDDRIYLKNKLINKIYTEYEKELERRDEFENLMAEMLSYYYKILGTHHVTGAMRNDYKRLLEMLQGVRHVSWQNDDNLVQIEKQIVNDCTVILCKYFNFHIYTEHSSPQILYYGTKRCCF